jgi:nitrogen fixation protein NifQ
MPPHYERLMQGPTPPCLDPFDRHITACIFARAWQESETTGAPWNAGTGLQPQPFLHLGRASFPAAAPQLAQSRPSPLAHAADEANLADLLWQCATNRSPMQQSLSAMLARRALLPNHLWQDLGLRCRGELSQLMARHFRALAVRNVNDMKWKKFLYRMMCADAAYMLCTAPSCGQCVDQLNCFGEE